MLISIHNKNPLEISKNIQQFKQGAVIKYENLLTIPVKDRLPGLVEQYGSQKIHGLLVVMLTEFCNFYNVIRPMTSAQIVSCAFELIGTSSEDFLSIEDLTIFFDGAKKGNYGKIYDRLDQQLIFEMLEVYRQERHLNYYKIKDEKECNFKAVGSQFRSSEDMSEIKELFHQANLGYYKTQNNPHGNVPNEQPNV